MKFENRRPLHAPLLVCFFVASLGAQPGRDKVDQGNQLYAEGKYSEARQKYLEALQEDPDSAIARFNEADALYRTEDFEGALSAYQQALQSGDKDLQARTWYNLGNALYHQKQLQESLEAFKQALKLDPDDQDSKHNLEMVLRQLQQRQKQQQKQSDQQDQDQQENQQQDENPGQSESQPEQRRAQGQEEQESQPKEQRQQEQQPEPGQEGRQVSSGQAKALSREEAERLLRAIKEDPREIRQKRRQAKQDTKVEKDW